MIDDYIANLEVWKPNEIKGIRDLVGEGLDSRLSMFYERLVDPRILITTPIHEGIQKTLLEVREVYGEKPYKFYNDVYIAVLMGLINTTLKDEPQERDV